MEKTQYFKFIAFSLVAILLANFVGIKVSQRQARDRQRILDIGNMERAVELYKAQYGYYPPSKDGKFFACPNTEVDLETKNIIKTQKIIGLERLLLLAKPCEWSIDYLGDIDDANAPRYLDPIPTDPKHAENVSYLYESDGATFSLYIFLEGKVDNVIPQMLTESKKCGNQFCNLRRTP